jgi:hypothetical protein
MLGWTARGVGVKPIRALCSADIRERRFPAVPFASLADKCHRTLQTRRTSVAGLRLEVTIPARSEALKIRIHCPEAGARLRCTANASSAVAVESGEGQAPSTPCSCDLGMSACMILSPNNSRTSIRFTVVCV